MKKKKIVLSIFIFIFVLISIFYIYVSSYYKATSKVNKYLKSNNIVKVTKINNGYYFNGPGKDKAIIFYQGGKVENIAYAPLLYELAEKDIDCFLPNMPYNLSIFNINAADDIINNYKYNTWYLSGHSLGGVAASIYTSNNKDKVSGLILLASYPNNKIDNNIKLLLIHGTNDGILNIDKYKSSKKYWSKKTKEVIIKGANHANFGYYGYQSKDNKATISKNNQQTRTIKEIINFLNG